MILAMKRLLFVLIGVGAMLAIAIAQQDSASQNSIAGPPQPVKAKPAKPPKAIKTPDPKPARHPGKGVTVVAVVVGTDGCTHDGKVIASSGSKETDDNALAAIQKWRFQPATVDGHPVAVQINISMDARQQ
jgi:protein TonB